MIHSDSPAFCCVHTVWKISGGQMPKLFYRGSQRTKTWRQWPQKNLVWGVSSHEDTIAAVSRPNSMHLLHCPQRINFHQTQVSIFPYFTYYVCYLFVIMCVCMYFFECVCCHAHTHPQSSRSSSVVAENNNCRHLLLPQLFLLVIQIQVHLQKNADRSVRSHCRHLR